MSSKAQIIQDAINQASLTMNVSEDVVRALKAGDTHPLLAKVIMNFHHSLEQQGKEITELRSSMLQIATTLARSADVSAASLTAVDAMANRLGIDMQSLFTAEATDGTEAPTCAC